MRSSPARLQQFKKHAHRMKRFLGKYLDIDTSWNDRYLMLYNAIIFEKAFARLNKENKYF